MAELLALGSAAAGVATVARWLTGSNTKTPVYTLTPPAFDRVKPDSVLAYTPLEMFLHPRRRLYTGHYTGDRGELASLRVHMAPRDAIQQNDFMAHIIVPRSQPGVPPRPFASARFHLQHSIDPNSFSNIVLRTEGGGNIYWNGAWNITSAIERARATTAAAAPKPATTDALPSAGTNSKTLPQLNGAGGVIASPAAPLQTTRIPPRGISAFFNLPLLHAPSVPAPPAGGEPRPFDYRPALRTSSVLGLRLDERSASGRGGWSVGLHCDPRSTLRALNAGRSEHLQLGGWLSQETDQFRMVAESQVQPLRSALPAVAVSPAAEGQPPAHHPVSAAVPPRLAASLPAIVSSRVGFFFTPARAGQLRPGYEVGFTLSNDSKGAQELVASYFHHLVVRRKIHNPFEKKENHSINNYVDLGMEVVYRSDASAGVAARDAPPSVRFGASWQPNKNSLAKFRVADSTVSLLYALKSWWEPSASAAFTLNHSFAKSETTVGMSVSIENIGEVLFSKPDPHYKRMIASQRENIANQIDLDEDY